MSKLEKVRKQTEQDLEEVRRARTELSEQLVLLQAEEAALLRKLELLGGTAAAVARGSLGDRIVEAVEELDGANPKRIVALLQSVDPEVKPNSVRAMLGQLLESGAISRPRRGYYAPAA